MPIDPCGPYGAFCGPYSWGAAFGIPFTPQVDCGSTGPCQLMADVYHPVPTAASPAPPPGGWPLVVAIPGGPSAPGGRGGLSPLASALAIRGAVVVLADWRESAQYGGGYPTSFNDVACAIRFARAEASHYGADPSRVTLVAHSFGGFAGAVVALSPKPFQPLAGQCLNSTGSGRPDAYVGIAPVSTLAAIGGDFLPAFFGGVRTDRPAVWDAADPLLLAQAPGSQPVPVRLVVGVADPTVPPQTVAPLADVLQASGRDFELIAIAGATHEDILIRTETIAAVLTVARP